MFTHVPVTYIMLVNFVKFLSYEPPFFLEDLDISALSSKVPRYERIENKRVVPLEAGAETHYL